MGCMFHYLKLILLCLEGFCFVFPFFQTKLKNHEAEKMSCKVAKEKNYFSATSELLSLVLKRNHCVSKFMIKKERLMFLLKVSVGILIESQFAIGVWSEIFLVNLQSCSRCMCHITNICIF